MIILDLGPPEGDGLSLLTHCRQSGIDLPILVLTEDGVRETVAALDAGADACMPKPFSLDELLARLRSLNRRGQVWADTRIRVHDLEINTGTHTVCRAGREIRLTPREYALLEFLALRPGKVLSRSMILEQVYHEGKMARSNVVDVYIRYLRKKVDKGFTLPLILTARGAGYLLRGE